MHDENSLKVEVVYALPERQEIIEVRLEPGATVRQAIVAAGLEKRFPDIVIDPSAVGIFSRKVSLDDSVRDGDRVEIYRPLIADPKEVRRQKALQDREAAKKSSA